VKNIGRPLIAGWLAGTTLLAALLLMASCAARGPRPQVTADLTRADALVRIGCYRCLREAEALYERHRSAAHAPAEAIRSGAFEATLLRALRERELGIPADETLARARQLAADLPPSSPYAANAETFLQLADLSYGELTSGAPETRKLPYPQWQKQITPLRDRVAVAGSARLAAYLVLTVDCADRTSREAIDTAQLRARYPATPLLEYRLALCGLSSDEELETLIESDPRWFEATWTKGSGVLATSRDVRAAAVLFAAAAEGLPEAPAVLLSLAGAERALRRLDAALASYDRVIAIVPTLRSALLGRVMCLTYLRRHHEAVETASRMIELGTYSIGDAHYWRAWNLYQLGQLESASTDAERALQLMSNTNVYTLAGLIKLDLKSLEDAESRLLEARRLDSSNCQAQFYLGLVYSAKPDWKQGGPAFTSAVSCFTQAAANARAELNRIAASSSPPDVKTAEAAEHQQTLEESELRTAQSAFNAAQCLVRTGNAGRAASYLDIAAEHPQVREQAERFRASMK
jgi:tetratricopeptide (TPR) repeat protein